MMQGGRGFGAYFGDENDLAVSLTMAIPVAYFLFLHSQGSKRMLYGLCAVLLILGVAISFSRGGFIGLVAIAIYCLWFTPRRSFSPSSPCLNGLRVSSLQLSGLPRFP